MPRVLDSRIFLFMPISTSSIIDLETHRYSFKTSSSISYFDSHSYTICLPQVHPWLDMFPSSSSLPSIPRVPTVTAAASIVIEVSDDPTVDGDAKGRVTRYRHTSSGTISSNSAVSWIQDVFVSCKSTVIIFRCRMRLEWLVTPSHVID